MVKATHWLAAVMLAAAGVAAAPSVTASAAAQASPFAAQARAAGLDQAQQSALQGRVDQILHQYPDGRQVAANEIALPHGGSVLLPLPGERYARLLTGAVRPGPLSANPGPSAVPNVTVHTAGAPGIRPADVGSGTPDSGTVYWYVNGVKQPGTGCAYEYFCLWQGQNGSGEQWNVSQCNDDQELPGSGWNTTGSWVNNQTPGTTAFLLNSGRSVIYTTPPPMYWNSAYNWGPVWYADACNH